MKIRKTIKELNYRPNVLARGLKQKKSQTIGIILPNVLYSFSSQVSRAIEDYFYGHGYHVIVCNSDDKLEKERNYIEMLLDKQVDGLIVFPTGDNKEIFSELASTQFPLVLIGRRIEGIPMEAVLLNNFNAAYEATRYLIDKGHERIAIFSQPLSNLSSRIDRLRGYKEALIDNKIPILEEYIQNIPLETVQGQLSALRSSSSPPSALLIGNDFIFKELLIFVRKYGVKVPEELSYIVFDQSPYVNFFNPTVSTVTQPTYDMGYKAAEILLAKINGTFLFSDTQKEFTFEGKLEIRES